ncbi:DUF1127 domain-containing protein [Rhodoligotrophos defluvii]|uniref:DUF1127 domain-containing protein n=1 Tax=Rhodoligotrophos defluvii TaxID=2561934 RepID=UPI0010C9C3C4|nr:DUF1127 domain-containing protein [Rhodoligotrophos defluvii]
MDQHGNAKITSWTWRLSAGLWRGLARLVWLIIRDWPDRWCQRRDLRELDDHRLRDIGISRMEAQREARKPFWR